MGDALPRIEHAADSLLEQAGVEDGAGTRHCRRASRRVDPAGRLPG